MHEGMKRSDAGPSNERVCCPSRGALIDEYKTCLDFAKSEDAGVWQMGAVLIPVSAASLAYLFSARGSQSASGPSMGTATASQGTATLLGVALGEGVIRLCAVSVVGGVAIVILWAWLQLFRRSYAYSRIAYYRMTEIEEVLGLWFATYGRALREPTVVTTRRSLDDASLIRLRKHFGGNPFPRMSTIPLVRLVVSVLMAGWLLLVATEILRVLA